MEEFLKTAKYTRTAIEINAYPLRLGLNDIYVKKAKEMGIPSVIGTDAHIIYQFDFMKYGIGTARRGWLTKKDVLNAYACKPMLKSLKSKPC